MAKSRAKAKGRKESGTFAAIPHSVMDTNDFQKLSPSGMKVIILLIRQYNGKNNGNLSATITQSRKYGVNSSASLTKALRELQTCNLIVRTREGFFMSAGGRCALYALTWRAIDECRGKDLELNPTTTPIRAFSTEK